MLMSHDKQMTKAKTSLRVFLSLNTQSKGSREEEQNRLAERLGSHTMEYLWLFIIVLWRCFVRDGL
jgi:hypothetical protein